MRKNIVRHFIHGASGHERVASGSITGQINLFSGKILQNDMLQANLAAQCISVGIGMPVKNNGIKIADQ